MNYIFKIILITLLFISGCAKHSAPAKHPVKPTVTKPQPSKQEKPQDISKLKAALILPLSGNSKELANNLADAAQLALFNSCDDKFSLFIIDSGTSNDSVKLAAETALNKGSKIILGPIFSNQTEEMAEQVKKDKLPIISFSNNTSLARKGIFLMGISPEQQVERVIKYSIKKEISDFILLLPANNYGRKLADQIRQITIAGDSAILKTEFYSDDDVSIKQAVESLSPYLKQNENSNHTKALFLAETGNKLEKVLTELDNANVNLNKIKLLGVGSWEDESTLKIPALKGAWFAAAVTDDKSNFEQQFQDKFGYKPVKLSSLAYDAVSLVCNIASNKGSYSNDHIINKQGFKGISGIFRFMKPGLAERGLSVLEVGDDQFEIIEPAPSKF